MFDLGYHKIPLGCASALFILATFLTPLCTRYWHFLLCQGLAVGVSTFWTCGGLNNQVGQISSGTIYGPTLAVIPHWFQKRLGMALGIVAVGSSIGGTMFPIIARSLIPVVG
jgi:MFS transporter, MCT family, solute carrier family 16 (monocarboxylic acid transporters), member 10